MAHLLAYISIPVKFSRSGNYEKLKGRDTAEIRSGVPWGFDMLQSIGNLTSTYLHTQLRMPGLY